jgi:hypothetical protein
MMPKFLQLLFYFCCFLLLFASIRGFSGHPTPADMSKAYWADEGPFELSPERGRYALLYSLVEDQSFQFSLPIAKFAVPDLGTIDGKYVSLFAPLLSIIMIPGYVIGKFFGLGQVGIITELVLFALANAILIQRILSRIGASRITGMLAGVIFVFATPAFTYAVSLYQHHVTTFFLLVCIFLLLKDSKSWLHHAVIWTMVGLSLSLDYPNAFIFFPIALYTLSRSFNATAPTIRSKVSFKLLSALLIFIIPLALFMRINYVSYGGPLRLAGTMQTVAGFDETGGPLNFEEMKQKKLQEAGDKTKTINPPLVPEEKSAIKFFYTRYIVNGLLVLFITPDRGALHFAPLTLIGLFGLILLHRRAISSTTEITRDSDDKSVLVIDSPSRNYPRNPSTHIDRSFPQLIVAIGTTIVLLYAMWGDPYGGWAFGGRYLIPFYALACILLGLMIDKWRKNVLFMLVISIIFFFSVYVNTIGALSTSRNPPLPEILALEKLTGKEQKYTYERNKDFLLANYSKSFVYQSFAKRYFTTFEYMIVVAGLIGFLGYTLFLSLLLIKKTD